MQVFGHNDHTEAIQYPPKDKPEARSADDRQLVTDFGQVRVYFSEDASEELQRFVRPKFLEGKNNQEVDSKDRPQDDEELGEGRAAGLAGLSVVEIAFEYPRLTLTFVKEQVKRLIFHLQSENTAIGPPKLISLAGEV